MASDEMTVCFICGGVGKNGKIDHHHPARGKYPNETYLLCPRCHGYITHEVPRSNTRLKWRESLKRLEVSGTDCERMVLAALKLQAMGYVALAKAVAKIPGIDLPWPRWWEEEER